MTYQPGGAAKSFAARRTDSRIPRSRRFFAPLQGFGRGHRRDFRRAVEQPEAVVLPMWDVIAEVFEDAAANGVEFLKAIRLQPVRLAFNLFCHVARWDHAA